MTPWGIPGSILSGIYTQSAVFSNVLFPTSHQISDFGMSRDVEDENYYVSSGGKVPVKWTAPEVHHYSRTSASSTIPCCINIQIGYPLQEVLHCQ